MTNTVVLLTENDRVEKCRRCYFWAPEVVHGRRPALYWIRGECRRRSPDLGYSSDDYRARWRTTGGDEWCGDFEPVVVGMEEEVRC